MDCLMCCEDGVVLGACIDDALKIIKKHFCYYQIFAQDKNKQIRLLQERNEKLSKAVCLLQRGAMPKNSQPSAMAQPTAAKRRRTDVDIYDLTQEETAGPTRDPANDTQSSQNVGESIDFLNSTQASYDSPKCSETVATIYDLTQGEIPVLIRSSQSPQALLLDVEARGATSSPNECQNSPNVSEGTEFLNATEAAPNSQNCIESGCLTEGAKNEEVCKNTDLTKIGDPLESTGDPSCSTFCDQEIVENRVLTAQSNSNQNVMADGRNETPEQLNERNADEGVAAKDFDPDETFIDLENCALKYNSPNEALEFVAPAEETNVLQSLNSSCVAVLTPEDVEFLEESFVDTDVKSMDWLEEIENNRLDKTLTKTKGTSSPLADKQNIQRTTSEQPSTSRNGNLPIKPEKFTQPTLIQEKSTLHNSCDESEGFVVHPLQVKEELMPDNLSARKLSLKERFNVDCRDCEKYIDFLAGQLTDEQIEQHLRSCTRHKEQDILVNQTPEDFWNPLLQSFPKDDPRNEILIDKRFLGTKRDN